MVAACHGRLLVKILLMVMVVVMVMVMMIVGADDGYDCVTLVDGTGTERNVKSKGQFI
jgi:hypothetical protein